MSHSKRRTSKVDHNCNDFQPIQNLPRQIQKIIFQIQNFMFQIHLLKVWKTTNLRFRKCILKVCELHYQMLKWIWKVWFQYLCRFNVAKTKCTLCFLKFRNRSHKFVVFRVEFQEWILVCDVSNSVIEFVEAFFSFLVISSNCAHCSKVSSRKTNCDCEKENWECQICTRISILIFV